MQFMPDVYVPCDVCHGARFTRETLQVHFKGLSIADVLDTTVEAGLELFTNFPSICNKLKLLSEVGLGYIRIGQPATTLSGGEAQRVKWLRNYPAGLPAGRSMSWMNHQSGCISRCP